LTVSSVPYRVTIGTRVTFLAGLAFERGSRWRSTQSRFESRLSHDSDDPFPFGVKIVTLDKFEDRVMKCDPLPYSYHTRTILVPYSYHTRTIPYRESCKQVPGRSGCVISTKLRAAQFTVRSFSPAPYGTILLGLTMLMFTVRERTRFPLSTSVTRVGGDGDAWRWLES
jgi:hypothetical protein